MNAQHNAAEHKLMLMLILSVCKSGCMDRKKTKTRPDHNWLQPDHWLRLPAFQNEKTAKRPVAIDQLQSVATGFRYALKTHTFWAYFEEKRARNACAMAKTICYGKIRHCAMSCSCIFWHVENFYHHKNYMVNYCTLYSIFYNWFYIQKYQF